MIKQYACSDGMCGADDCYRCHPERFVNNNDIVTCKTCGWKGSCEDMLEAPHPFQDGCLCYGCPECKEIENVE
jgi:hypothetical protein